jgi:hypothetical protein
MQTTVTLTIDDEGLGVIDSEAKRAFTRGQCHALAVAINKLTGWTIKGVGRDFCGDYSLSPCHCVVYASELKAYVDINGASKRVPRLNYHDTFRIVNRNISAKTIRAEKLEGYIKPNVRAAMPFAKALVQMVRQSG